MLKTVKGHCSHGKLELFEIPQINESDVIVTFIDDTASVDLASRSISKRQAQDLRNRFRTLADDWDAPEMEIYDCV